MNIRKDLFFLTALLVLLLAACAPIDPATTLEAASDSGAATDAETDAGVAPPTVTFTAAGYAYDGPASIPGGLTRIEFANTDEQEHTLWLLKLDEGKSFEDVMGVFATIETDPQMPEWMVWYGGVTAGPGMTSAYTINLAPGSYAIFSFSQDEEGVPDMVKGMQATLTVTEGEAMGVTPPAANLRTEMIDFSYVIEGEFVAGPQIVEATNTGMEPHEAVMLNLADGATVEDALDFLMAGEAAGGPPPFAAVGGIAPMSTGLTAWYEINAEAGEVGLICFIPSVANGGAPHFMLGMVAQVTVSGP